MANQKPATKVKKQKKTHHHTLFQGKRLQPPVKGLEILQNHRLEIFFPQPPLNIYHPSQEFSPAVRCAKWLVQKDVLGSAAKKQQLEGIEIHNLDIDVMSLPHCKSAWMGYSGSQRDVQSNDRHWTVLKNTGNAQVLVDRCDRLCVVKCKVPDLSWSVVVSGHKHGWFSVINEVEAALHAFSTGLNIDSKAFDSGNRGPHPSVSFGNTLGPGQAAPATLVHPDPVEFRIKVFSENPFVVAYTTHVADMFRAWQPRVAELYSLAQLQHLMSDNLAAQYFPNLQFAACTLNFGRQTATGLHLDVRNLPFGFCAVGVFGLFDHESSGRLIFPEVKASLALARGDIVFFPSALLKHKNGPLLPKEYRQSIVFYTSGPFIGWLQHRNGTPESNTTNGEARWKEGCQLISTLGSLGF